MDKSHPELPLRNFIKTVLKQSRILTSDWENSALVKVILMNGELQLN
jgi:hypothetical protein